MKKAIRNILILSVLSVFIAGTNGVLLIFHHCNSGNQTKVLLFYPDKDPCGDEPVEACCAEETNEHSCCDLPSVSCSREHENNNGTALHSKKCCYNSSTYFKIRTDFVSSGKTKVNLQKLFPVMIQLSPMATAEKTPVLHGSGNDPPDPEKFPAGNIYLYHQSLLI